MRLCFKAMRDIAAGEELLMNYQTDHLAPLVSFMMFGFSFQPSNETGSMTVDASGTGVERNGSSDQCQGLRPHEFTQPAPDADPILRNFWHFATAHCHGGDARPPADARDEI